MAHTRSNRSSTVMVCSWLLGACGGKSASPELPVDPVPNPDDVATDDGASGASGATAMGGSAGSIGEPPLSTAETCSDGVLDGDEADVDCGGSRCGACSTGASCRVGFDCEGLSCLNGRCQQPTCADGLHNGDELDVDCGGSCGRCPIVFEPCDCPTSEQLQALACGDIDLWSSFLSADGDTLVYDQNGATYRWTAATGPVLQRGDASVAGLSADGQTLLLNVETSGTYELWGPGQPSLALPIGSAMGLSDDARSVLLFDEGRRAATLWNDGFSLTVGGSSGGSFDFPEALSADGQVVVGTRIVSDPKGGYERPFRWTRAGMETLEPLPDGATRGAAVVTSRDGSVLAGWVSSSADYLSSNIFRWTPDQGFVELATAPIVAGLALPPPLLSDDGAVLVGTFGPAPSVPTSCARFVGAKRKGC